MFEEDSKMPIDMDEFKEDENLTIFIHALANVAPAAFYESLTNTKTNSLEFNHLANRLCFQYIKRED